MDQPKFTSRTRSIFNDFFSHIEINYFMSPNMQIILLNERCLTSQIQLICKCKWGFICDILYGWEKTKRLLNCNTNCCDWLSHIIIHSESSKYQISDKKISSAHWETCLLSVFIRVLVTAQRCVSALAWGLRAPLSFPQNAGWINYTQNKASLKVRQI